VNYFVALSYSKFEKSLTDFNAYMPIGSLSNLMLPFANEASV